MTMINFKGYQTNDNNAKSFMQKLLISHDSKWKNIFDLIVLFLIGYSCMEILF